MVNCNPETVSTDYDISDRLYFEPLTFESVMEIIEREKPYGVIVQFGGQTPLKLADALEKAGVPVLGTPVESIDTAEDRERFAALVDRLGLRQPQGNTATSIEKALECAAEIGYPLMIRPSFVLGGRAMRVVQNEDELRNYMAEGVEVSNDRPVLLDSFLQNAIEVDVDAVCDGKDAVVAGVMEHIERAGIHSGDSSCCIPPPTLPALVIEEIKRQTRLLALELNVVGLLNVQFAVQQSGIFILEANPRASRTVPFVSKACGIPWAKMAAKLMVGHTLQSLKVKEHPALPYHAIKACAFPFNRFPGVDILLGPEMKSTGEVMGIDRSFAGGFAKAQAATLNNLPTEGTAFLSVRDGDKGEELLLIARRLYSLGFSLVGTAGTSRYLEKNGIVVKSVNKVSEGSPNIVDLLGSGEISIVINTPEGTNPFQDSRSIRVIASELKVPTFTTLAAASAAVQSIGIIREKSTLGVLALQEYHELLQIL